MEEIFQVPKFGENSTAVLYVLSRGFTAIPPNNVTFSVRLDENIYLVWRE